MNATIKLAENVEIEEKSSVKIKKMNHIIEVTYIQRKSNALSRFKKLNKDNMLDMVTGEIIQVEHKENRGLNISTLRKTISNLRDIVNMNFTGQENELFITLTYAENMKDLKRLYHDFDKFYKKLKRRFKQQELLYISAVEPQERGAWHIHLLLKNLSSERLYIRNEDIEALWGQGFTFTKRLEQVDNVGAYISSYLINIKDGEQTKKGQRLYLYPSGMNIYRTSKNIKKPTITEKIYSEFKKHIPEQTKTYEKTYQIIDDAENVINTVKKEYYNLKRL